MFNFLLDFIFPKHCVHCGTYGSYLCSNCQKQIRSIEQAICPMCERPAIGGKTHAGCQTRYSLDGLISFFRFEGTVKKAMHRLKYKPYLADLVPTLLENAETLMETEELFADFLVVPVPLHPRRERERGFNQSALISKAISEQLSLQFQNTILRKIRYTKPQVELKGEERRKNLIGAFEITKRYPLYPIRSILLVDDVWTTGSTMRACANVLKRAGVKNVWAMTLTR